MKLTKQQMVRLYTNMVRVRTLDRVLTKATLQGKVPGFHFTQELQEASSVGACSFLRKDDYVFLTHRGSGIGKTLPKGVSAKTIVAEHFGKATGNCGGFSGFHTCDPELGILGVSGIVGSELTLAAGVGIAAKMRGKRQVVVCFMGDGSVGRGTFHEAALMAANWKLPVIWMIENNQYSGVTPVKEVYPKDNLADLAFGYGMPGVVVDGQDVIAVCEAVQTAIERARDGIGPSLIECKTYCVSSGSASRGYGGSVQVNFQRKEPRPAEEIELWKKRDPITLFKKKLLEENILAGADFERIEREAEKEMENAERFASESPLPDPKILKEAIYAD